MLELLKYCTSGFWVFIGTFSFFTAALRMIFLMWNRLVRHLSVRSKGWPPSHLDADGDWKPEKDNNNGES